MGMLIIMTVVEAVEVARKAVDAALNKQAADIILLDLRAVCAFTDYFIICSGDSERQIQAICDEIGETLKREGIPPPHCEGSPDSGWVILDFGDIVVHIFAPEERWYYELERLWSEATAVVRIL
jgi:ribosome-associated protein